MKSIGGTCTRESYDFGSSGGGHRGNYGAGGAVRPSPIRSVPMRGGVILVHEFVAAQPQLQAWGLKPFADPEAEFNRLDATNNTTADGEVDWDEFLAWAIEHKLDRDDDDSDDESLLQAADVKKRPSVQKASELQK